MEDDAVGLVHLDLLGRHDDRLALHIDLEECHGIRLVIEADQMLVIREERCILGILSADRKAENLFQISVIGIDLEDDHRVVAGV